MTRRDTDKTWLPPMGKPFEPMLEQPAAGVSLGDAGPADVAGANDTFPQPVPPVPHEAAQNDTPVDAEDDTKWRTLLEALRGEGAADSDPDEADTTDPDPHDLMQGLELAAQRLRVGPPVVTDVTDGHRAAIYSAPSSTIPPSLQGTRPVGAYTPRGVLFSRTEQIPLPRPPSAPPPSEPEPLTPPSSDAIPVDGAAASRRAPTVRIRRSDPPAVVDYTPPGARRGRVAVLAAFVGTVAVGCILAFVVLPREAASPAPSAAPAASSAIPAAATQSEAAPLLPSAQPPPAISVSPTSSAPAVEPLPAPAPAPSPTPRPRPPSTRTRAAPAPRPAAPQPTQAKRSFDDTP